MNTALLTAPHIVQAQVAFERHVLKPVFHMIGAKVETRRLSAMGQGESTCTPPPQHGDVVHPPRRDDLGAHAVALQVAFERQNFETGFPLDRL
jgi:hypothetical protein